MSDSAVRENLDDAGRISNTVNDNRTLSTFESLPLEILEKIFFYSVNVNLPRALPKLAAFISNERVYRLLILLAFWNNDYDYDQHYNTSEGKDVVGGDPARYGDFGKYTWRENRMFNIPWILRPLGCDYVRLSPDARRMLQSGILTCKWCTHERIRSQLPDLGRLIIARWCINAGYIFEDERVSRVFEGLQHPEEKEVVHEGVVVRVNKKRPEERGQGEEKDDYPRCRVIVAPGEFVKFKFEGPEKGDDSSIHSELELDQGPDVTKLELFFPVLSILEIPAHLFRPDVRSDRYGINVLLDNVSGARVLFLNTLRLSGQLMPHIRSGDLPEIAHSRDALQHSIRAALYTLNIRALDMFLRLDLFFCRDMRPYYTIPPDLFLIAATLYSDSVDSRKESSDPTEKSHLEIVEEVALVSFHFLLVSSAESLPYEDPAVRQVAVSAGGVYGKWLWDLMEILPGHVEKLEEMENCEYDTMFFSRCFNYDASPEMEETYAEEVFGERCYLGIPEEWLADDLERYGEHEKH